MVMVVVVVVVVVVEGADAPQTTARPAENFRSGSIAEEDARVDMPARDTAGRGHSVARVRRAGTTNAFAHAMVRIASKRGFPYSFLSFFPTVQGSSLLVTNSNFSLTHTMFEARLQEADVLKKVCPASRCRTRAEGGGRAVVRP